MRVSRWALRDVFRWIGQAGSQLAAEALLREGERRCDLLDAASPATAEAGAAGKLGGAQDVGSSEEEEEEEEGGRAQAAVDGWGFDEDDGEDAGEGGGKGRGGGRSSGVVAEGSSRDAGRGRAGAVPGRGSDPLRARLLALRALFETFLQSQAALERGFEAARLEEFLFVGSSSGGAGSRGWGCVGRSPGRQVMWEEPRQRRALVERAMRKLAAEGAASALGVFFERHPEETLPIRLEILRCVRISSGEGRIRGDGGAGAGARPPSPLPPLGPCDFLPREKSRWMTGWHRPTVWRVSLVDGC